MSEPICLCLNRFWWMFGQILINASSEDLASHVSQTFNVIWASSIIAFWHDASKNVRQSTIVVLKPDSNIFFFPQQIFSKWAKFRYYWVIMKKFGSHLSGQRHRLILFPDLQRNSQDWIKWEKWEWKNCKHYITCQRGHRLISFLAFKQSNHICREIIFLG